MIRAAVDFQRIFTRGVTVRTPTGRVAIVNRAMAYPKTDLRYELTYLNGDGEVCLRPEHLTFISAPGGRT